jgi:hypothetical protein
MKQIYYKTDNIFYEFFKGSYEDTLKNLVKFNRQIPKACTFIIKSNQTENIILWSSIKLLQESNLTQMTYNQTYEFLENFSN